MDPDDAPRRFHPGALAANWRQILAVDAAMGLLVLAAGLVVAVVWSPPIGAGLGALGAVYVVLVARRARDWRSQRRDAGLDG